MSTHTERLEVRSKSLWDQAFLGLPEDVRSNLPATQDNLDILDALLKSVADARKASENEKWQFKRKDGRVVLVTDIIEKIVRIVHQVREIGDVAVQFDPSHAALPWAGIRLVLELAVGNFQLLTTITQQMEKVSLIIARYAIIELQCLGTGLSAHTEDKIRGVLSRLYASVLTLLAMVIKHYKANRLRRHLAGAFPIALVRAAEDVDDADKQASLMVQAAKLDRLGSLSKHVNEFSLRLDALDKSFSRLSQVERNYSQVIREAKFSKISSWLSSVRYADHHQSISTGLVQGTGSWFLNSQQYQTWQSTTGSSILNLHGPPGCGKTALTSVVVEDITKAATSPYFGYFYCSKATAEVERADLSTVLRTIAKQFCCASNDYRVETFLLDRYAQKAQANNINDSLLPTLSLREAEEALLDCLENGHGTIVIDAIDELGRQQERDLINILERLVVESTNVVRIFITSRVSHCVDGGYWRRCEVSKTDTAVDMKQFITVQIEQTIKSKRLLGGQIDSDLLEKISSTLLNNANGMFLWVSLKIDQLCGLEFEQDLLDVLGVLSIESLDGLLSQIYDEIQAQGPTAQRLSLAIFTWILGAREPLSTEAILLALKVNDVQIFPTTHILKMCRSLVTEEEHSGSLKFCHASVHDFVSHRIQSHQMNADRMLAEYCMRICGASDGIGSVPQSPQRELLQYSAIYWPEHYQSAIQLDQSGELLRVVKDFVIDEDELSVEFTQWVLDADQIFVWIGDCYGIKPAIEALSRRVDTPIFMCCIYGMTDILRDAIKFKIINVNDQNQQGKSGLYLASAYGHSEVVRLLLENGADVSIEGGHYGSPLVAACVYGNLHIVQLLCQYDAIARCGTLLDALFVSIDRNHDDIAIFLTSSSLSSISQAEMADALDRAVSTGSTKFLDYLQGRNKTLGGHAIVVASRKGKAHVVQWWIAKLQANSAECDMALVQAAAYNRPQIIKLLVEAGTSLMAPSQTLSPLVIAALHGNLSAVNTLLELSKEHSKALNLTQALEFAARNGRVQVVAALMDAGAEVNKSEALQFAANCGQIEITRELVLRGGDLMQKGRFGNVFDAAVAGREPLILELFDDLGLLPEQYRGQGKNAEYGEREGGYLEKPRSTERTRWVQLEIFVNCNLLPKDEARRTSEIRQPRALKSSNSTTARSFFS